MIDDGSAGSPQADDRGISNMGLRVVSGSAETSASSVESLTVEALSRTISVFAHLQLAFSPKLEVRNSKSEISDTLNSPSSPLNRDQSPTTGHPQLAFSPKFAIRNPKSEIPVLAPCQDVWQ